MVSKLSTTINKIESLPNSSNIKIIDEFLTYWKLMVHQKDIRIII